MFSIGNSTNWKLFQILFILQNCLILQTACHLHSTSANEHGLLRSSGKGIFIPSNARDGEEVNMQMTVVTEKSDNSESMSMPSKDPNVIEDKTLEDKNIEDVETIQTAQPEPPEPEEEGEDDYEGDTNKAKRSRGYLKRLLQRLGLAPSREPFREREFEAQMADDASMDADGGGDSAPPTTAKPGGGLLSKLNPINKISYKINTAKSVVNRALNVVGLGSKPAGSGGAEGGAGAGQEGAGGEDGSTREGGGGDDATDSSELITWSGWSLVGGLLAVGVVLREM